MSFGWSASDVALAIQFLGDVAQALRDTGGSRQEYQQSAAFITGLEQTLRNVTTTQAYLARNASTDSTLLQAQRIVDAIKPFMSQIDKYREPLTSPESHHRHRKLKAKLEWGFSGRKKMHDFANHLAIPLTTINTDVSNQTLHMVAELQDKLPQILQTEVVNKLTSTMPSQIDPHTTAIASQLTRLDHAVTKTQDQVMIQQRTTESLALGMDRWYSEMTLLRKGVEKLQLQSFDQAPQHGSAVLENNGVMSYPESLDNMIRLLKLITMATSELMLAMLQLLWPFAVVLLSRLSAAARRLPTLSIADSIFFEDALGRSRKLPFEFFQHWTMVQVYLVQSFKGQPGLAQIIQGKYHLSRVSDGVLIDPKKWATFVRPGTRVSMAVVKVSYGKPVEEECHECGMKVHQVGRVSQRCTACDKQINSYCEPNIPFILPRDGGSKRPLEQKVDNQISLDSKRRSPVHQMAPRVSDLDQIEEATDLEDRHFKMLDRVCLTDPLRILDTMESLILLLMRQTWINSEQMEQLQTLIEVFKTLREEVQGLKITMFDYDRSYNQFCNCAEAFSQQIESLIRKQEITTDQLQCRFNSGYNHGYGTYCPIYILREVFKESSLTSHAFRLWVRAEKTVVLVMTMTGRLNVMTMRTWDTVLQLKEALYDAEGLPPSRQHLVYVGRKLIDARTIADYDITPNYYVHMLLPLWGDRSGVYT